MFSRSLWQAGERLGSRFSQVLSQTLRRDSAALVRQTDSLRGRAGQVLSRTQTSGRFNTPLQAAARFVSSGASSDSARAVMREMLPLRRQPVASGTAHATYVSPYDLKKAPIPTIVLYNQSPHANNFAIEQLKAVWPSLRIIQVCQNGRTPNKGADDVLYIPKEKWGDIAYFAQRFFEKLHADPALANQMAAGEVGLYPIWSALAEDPQVAQALIDAGFRWIGASPSVMQGLHKIAYKKLCQQQGISTAPFLELYAEAGKTTDANIERMADDLLARIGASELKDSPIFLKHIHGGGGRGSVKIKEVTRDNVIAGLRKIIGETGGDPSGVYAEKSLDFSGATLYQLELEGDGVVAPGGRLVWFNDRNQKVIEAGLTDSEITKLIPRDVYAVCREQAQRIFTVSGYNNRGTNEILLVKRQDGSWEIYHSELNQRIQVENKALSDLVEKKNVPAEQVMRALGYPAPAPTDSRESGVKVAGHIRILAAEPRKTGWVFPPNVDVTGFFMPPGDANSVSVNLGPVHLDTDPQVGMKMIHADSWEDFCDKLAYFAANFQLIGPGVEHSRYNRFLQQLAANPEFRSLALGCNRTSDVLQDPPRELGRIPHVVQLLKGPIRELVVRGYRPGEGFPNQPDPTDAQIKDFQQMRQALAAMNTPMDTPFAHLVEELRAGHGWKALSAYYDRLRDLMGAHGGAINTVFPRDTDQEGADSESVLIQAICAEIASKPGAATGVLVGYEIDGAQKQVAALRGFDPWAVMRYGLLPNIGTDPLKRGKYWNGLEELMAAESAFVSRTEAAEVRRRYGVLPDDPAPYFPNMFHAGNHSNHDLVISQALQAGIPVVPNWAWDPRYTPDQYQAWVQRQFALYENAGQVCQVFRVKNAGENPEHWTAEHVWSLVQTVIQMGRARYGQSYTPIFRIHNHNFSGLASHVAAQLLKIAQLNGYPYLVIDTSIPGTTHNNNLIVTRALQMTSEQRDALMMYNRFSLMVHALNRRFHIQTASFRDPFTPWAGGTDSSDVSSAQKMGIPLDRMEPAKRLAAEVFNIATLVTPHSEWAKWLGFAIETNPQIVPKTREAVEAYIQRGGKLNIDPKILEGLQKWEMSLPRPPIVERLLHNHGLSASPPPASVQPAELDVEGLRRKLQVAYPHLLIGDREVATAVGLRQIGVNFLELKNQYQDLTALLDSPDFVCKKERVPGDWFEVDGVPVELVSKLTNPQTAEVSIVYRVAGQLVSTKTVDKVLQRKSQGSGAPQVRHAEPKNKLHVGALMPGALNRVFVKPGEEIKKGQPLYEIESMKMKTVISAQGDQEGLIVQQVWANPGGVVELNQLVVELKVS